MTNTPLADLAMREQTVDRTHELEVVHRHDDRDLAAMKRGQQRRRQLVVDVVDVREVDPAVIEQLCHLETRLS